ncbi:hypothetical protein N7520_009059 [Penicillium odoratum]|uniref:uncharacterized protein n=1 Tax=Penicillium odoratum TaxID=1167516 RepID=UPI0025470584|nr:uncharacterized protein N7520_009059 [Penicillium odoratum]KAJ5752142.1 hypothetical protein N7520_009059 [Penicillium odoratum]
MAPKLNGSDEFCQWKEDLQLPSPWALRTIQVIEGKFFVLHCGIKLVVPSYDEESSPNRLSLDSDSTCGNDLVYLGGSRNGCNSLTRNLAEPAFDLRSETEIAVGTVADMRDALNHASLRLVEWAGTAVKSCKKSFGITIKMEFPVTADFASEVTKMASLNNGPRSCIRFLTLIGPALLKPEPICSRSKNA